MNLLLEEDDALIDQTWQLFTFYALQDEPSDYHHMTKCQFFTFARDVGALDDKAFVDGGYDEGRLAFAQLESIFRHARTRTMPSKMLCYFSFIRAVAEIAQEVYVEEDSSVSRFVNDMVTKFPRRCSFLTKRRRDDETVRSQKSNTVLDRFSSSLKPIYDAYVCTPEKMTLRELQRFFIDFSIETSIRDTAVLFLTSSSSPMCPYERGNISAESKCTHYVSFNSFKNILFTISQRQYPSLNDVSPDRKVSACLYRIWRAMGDAKVCDKSYARSFYDTFEKMWRHDGHPEEYVHSTHRREDRERRDQRLKNRRGGTYTYGDPSSGIPMVDAGSLTKLKRMLRLLSSTSSSSPPDQTSNSVVWETKIIPLARRRPVIARLILSRGWTLLHHCAADKFACTNVVQQIVELWPESGTRERARMTRRLPLHVACERRQSVPDYRVSVVDLLIKSYPEAVRGKDVHGMCPIHVASSHPDADVGVIDALHASWPSGVQQTDRCNMLPLHHAILHRASTKVLTRLLDLYPVSCIKADKHGRYPFNLTSDLTRSEDSISSSQSVLLNAMRHLSSTSSTTTTATQIEHAARNILRYEVERGHPRWTTVFLPLLEMTPKFANELCEQGKYPLHYACEKCAPTPVISRLLTMNIKATMCRSRYGWLPLHYGVISLLSVESIRLLVHAYPRSTEQLEWRWKYPPLHFAVEVCARDDVVRVLLDSFPDAKTHCPACAAVALLVTRRTRGIFGKEDKQDDRQASQIIANDACMRNRWIEEARRVANRVVFDDEGTKVNTEGLCV